jgi:hypothetical protein
MEWLVKVWQRHGMERHDNGVEMAWHGKEWKWNEMAWLGEAWKWYGMTRHVNGMERKGMPWHGMERKDMQWEGKVWQ